MISRSVLLATCLAAVACGSSLGSGQDAAAGAGSGGRGGTAAVGGFHEGAGAGGDAGSAAGGTGGVATCVFQNPTPTAMVYSDDSTHPRLPVSAPVTVVSVDDCATAGCGSMSSLATRIVLSETSGRRWTAYAVFPGMPADIVTVGEALDLRVELHQVPYPQQTFDYWTTVLARGGTAVIFDVSAASDLTPYGIAVARSTSARCQSGCYTVYAADVSYGTESRNVAPDQTVQVGKLSFSLRGFAELTGGCDTPTYTESMSGFTAR
jgi:hypothetical protein